MTCERCECLLTTTSRKYQKTAFFLIFRKRVCSRLVSCLPITSNPFPSCITKSVNVIQIFLSSYICCSCLTFLKSVEQYPQTFNKATKRRIDDERERGGKKATRSALVNPAKIRSQIYDQIDLRSPKTKAFGRNRIFHFFVIIRFLHLNRPNPSINPMCSYSNTAH